MESNNSPSQQPVPRQPQPGMRPRPVQQMGHRPVIDGFAPHRPTTPPTTPVARRPVSDFRAPPQPVRPQQPMQPQHHTAMPTAPVPQPVQSPHQQQPAHHPVQNPVLHHQTQQTQLQHQSQPEQRAWTGSTASTAPQKEQFTQRPAGPVIPAGGAMQHQFNAATPAQSQTSQTSSFAVPPTDDGDMSPASKAKAPKEKSGSHAGIIGTILFVVLALLLLSPIIPGKISNNFPLASSAFSTGDQSLDCIGTQGSINSQLVYNTKLGTPFNYKYSTMTTESQTCNGKTIRAVAGHTSQFSPLGMIIDLLVALAVAIIVGRVWLLLYERRADTRPRPS